MISQVIHNHNYQRLLVRLRKRSAILIFFAIAGFFAYNPAGAQEICNNGKDDDLNGWVDCQDPACKEYLQFCPEGDTGKFPSDN